LTEDIIEPLELYRTSLKEAHARYVSEYFEDLARRSCVDESANARTVAEMRKVEASIKRDSSSDRWWGILRVAVIVGAVICAVLSTRHLFFIGGVLEGAGYAVCAVAGTVYVLRSLNPRIRAIRERLALLKKECSEKLDEAWKQMAPLNQLYNWGMFAELIRRTVPRIAIDPYFANGRLHELRESFGWRDQINEESSMLFAHSGELNGNPLVIGKALHHWMGTKTYNGSLTIRWTEYVKDSSGRMQAKTRTQTLRASLEKPFPRYSPRPFIIYGNEAAPDLSFSRKPSGLSDLGEGMLDSIRKSIAVKSLERKSRDMSNDFTMMANRDFETLFSATDRDHEVQFRLLFTALAQQEMVKLLKDKASGYGDSCVFTKSGMINLVEPQHMAETDISSAPEQYHAYEMAAARKFFNEHQNELFRSVFFGLAPLLAIPLYQQHRSHADIYRDASSKCSCFWEHESIANYFGESRFKHPECITQSILKTESSPGPDGLQVVRVAAFGYCGVQRVEYVRKYGGDGNYHDVPVEWVEYIAVRHDSEMVLKDQAGPESDADDSETAKSDWKSAFEALGADPGQAVLRRSIIAAVR
jgi:hypothetical protein